MTFVGLINKFLAGLTILVYLTTTVPLVVLAQNNDSNNNHIIIKLRLVKDKDQDGEVQEVKVKLEPTEPSIQEPPTLFFVKVSEEDEERAEKNVITIALKLAEEVPLKPPFFGIVETVRQIIKVVLNPVIQVALNLVKEEPKKAPAEEAAVPAAPTINGPSVPVVEAVKTVLPTCRLILESPITTVTEFILKYAFFSPDPNAFAEIFQNLFFSGYTVTNKIAEVRGEGILRVPVKANGATATNFHITDINNRICPGSQYPTLPTTASGIPTTGGASNVGSLTITTASLPDADRNISYSQTLTASGGTSPYTWSISAGALPAGLTLNSSTGVISGTTITDPNATYSFTARVTDRAAAIRERNLSIVVFGS